ncbi:fructokinase [Natronocella acetinitrilica]|uniref:Fructokinase n=1 Tax=Natronocella acetinitrilica TaxID=414046 RepID=A0AAE3G3B4_9GAMM|nr:carbohydrate kinase [Natronocella acetinitrilica]MCP1673916.1 fructokinase [Natronocella acetinitrilica]
MLLTCGEALIDLVPGESGDSDFKPVPGGAPYNVACAVSRMGAPAAFLGAVADDWLGELLRARLRETGVDTGLLAQRTAATPIALVRRNPTGSAEYIFHGLGPDSPCLTEEHIPANLPDQVNCIVTGGLAAGLPGSAEVVEALLERERGHRLLVLDPNIRPTLMYDRPALLDRWWRQLACADIVKVSDEDVGWLAPGEEPEAFARHLLEHGPALVVLTRGGDGAVALTLKERVFVRPPKITVRDTVGAGDTYTAACLVWLHRQGLLSRDATVGLGRGPLHELLRFASAAAAICCTRAGAETPTLDEVQSLLTRTASVGGT